MADPKSYEPEKLTSGVTWKWKKTISDYPASEWTLTYYLRKDGVTATSFSATADGDTHLVTVTAATTAGYAAGTPTRPSNGRCHQIFRLAKRCLFPDPIRCAEPVVHLLDKRSNDFPGLRDVATVLGGNHPGVQRGSQALEGGLVGCIR